MSTKTTKDEIVLTEGDVCLRESDVSTLDDHCFLSDMIISFAYQMLEQKIDVLLNECKTDDSVDEKKTKILKKQCFVQASSVYLANCLGGDGKETKKYNNDKFK